jgi:hypothetical protein
LAQPVRQGKDRRQQEQNGGSLVKRLWIMPLLLIAAPAAAQTPDTKSACARDVSRFCRAKMNDGDMVVLACLKENRAKLGKACAKVLTDNGQ